MEALCTTNMTAVAVRHHFSLFRLWQVLGTQRILKKGLVLLWAEGTFIPAWARGWPGHRTHLLRHFFEAGLCDGR